MAPAMNTSAAAAEADGAGLSKADFLFESVVCDLHLAARSAGGFAMLLSARAATDATWTLRAWRSRMHDDVQSMQLTLRFHAEMGLPAALAAQVTAAYAGFTRAMAETPGDAALSGEDRAALGRRAETWRRVSAGFKAALEGLAAETRRRLPEAYGADAQALIVFLDEAARGERGRVNRFGVIELPQLSQRRSAPRAQVRHACVLATAGGRFAAEIEDVSRGGLGLRCRAALKEGEEVVVEFAGGRRLQGVVARRQGELAGLKLSAPLPVGDPLFGRG